MQLLICEYVTAGGLGPAAQLPLLDEADAMVQALVRDFSAVPRVQVSILRCPSLSPVPGVLTIDWCAGAYEHALLTCDAVLLIAPETDDCLEQLVRQAEAAQVQVLSCSSGAVAQTSDKRRCATRLSEAGIACVDVAAWHDVPDARSNADRSWVLKPVDGCGCDGVQRFATFAEAEQALMQRTGSGPQVGPGNDPACGAGDVPGVRLDANAHAGLPGAARQGWLLQPWVEGTAASLCVLGSAQGARLLSVNRQHLRLDGAGRVTLDHVETGALADPDGALAALAETVQGAIPGLRGIYGIDLVLTAEGPCVVEINPRLTSAYPGLRAVLQENPAILWLASAGCLPVAGTPAIAAPASRAALLGWDIGGAHLKVAVLDGHGQLLAVEQLACALWRGLDQLEPLLDRVIARWGNPGQHAITMSGEMVDLFVDRAAGVRQLLHTFGVHAKGVPVAVYAGLAGFLPATDTAGAEASIGSANWLASGAWAARHLPHGLLLDIGSTTTDLLWFAKGRIQPDGVGDQARLISQELVYTGLTRTPLMALASRVPLTNGDGSRHDCGVMAEWFATSADVYRVLDLLPESADQHPTADGQRKTWAGSARRMARMVGCDLQDHPEGTWIDLARHFQACQGERIGAALQRRLAAQPPASAGPVPVVLAGVGRFLAAPWCTGAKLSAVEFADLGGLCPAGRPTGTHHATANLREAASRAAPAVAVAALLAHG